MNPLYQYIVTETIRRRFRKKTDASADVPSANLKSSVVEITHLLGESVMILLGVASATVGLKGFLLPSGFLDGGITGVSLILTRVTGFPLPALIVILNLPFIVMAFSNVGRGFAIRSAIAISVLAVSVHFMPITAITQDKLLVAVFGGIFLGAGIGLAVRGGSVIDGTEVLGVYLSRKTVLTIGDIILMINILIFGIAAYVFNTETALYAVLTYIVASKTVDVVIIGMEEYVGVTIISDKSEEIRLAIIENLGRGCTIYSGKKGFAGRGESLKPTDVVYTLITRLELAKLQTEVDKIDTRAFMIMHSIKDARGGMIKKRPLK